jgi:two-component system, NtrC family, sensor kinase
MRVRTKFVAVTLFVAVVPLAMFASQSIRLHERALDDALMDLHRAAAALGAQVVDQHLARTEGALRATVHDTIDWQDLSAAERQAALWLLFGQFESSAVATLTQHGTVSERAYLAQSSATSPGHPMFSERDVQEFDHVTPPAEGEVAVGAPMRTEAGVVVLPLSANEAAVDGQPRAQVSIGLSLEPLCAALSKAQPRAGAVWLLDSWNRRVCENGQLSTLTAVEHTLAGVLNAKSSLYSRQSGAGAVKGAVAGAAHGFKVVVEQPLELVTAPARRLRWQTFFWLLLGVAAALASGWVLGRNLLVPLERLAHAARRIGRGDFGGELGIGARRDEFSDLAESFNTMTRAIAERDHEIQTWNATLQERVDQRGRQLEEAQRALLQSQRMAGLAVTTAGVAHEMNNPLTGVLGLAQVLSARLRKRESRDSDVSMLSSIVEESKRMQALLQRMGSLEVSHGDGLRLHNLRLSSILDGVLLAHRDRLQQADVTVGRNYEPALEVLSDPYRLHAIFAEVLDNALKAVSYCAPGVQRRVDFAVTDGDGWLDVTLSDNGRGIEAEHVDRVFEPFFTTKLCGQGEGLGLAQVYRMVEGIGGKVTIQSELRVGTQVTVRLPRAHAGGILA